MIDQLIEDERGRDRMLARMARAVLPCRVSIIDGRPRSHKENRLYWVWLSEAASQLQDTTVIELQWEWKLRFGVPLLMTENNKFADMWARVERSHNHSDRLRMMEWIDVTRLLSVKGFALMLDAIFRDCAANNIRLTDPEERNFGTISSRVDRGRTEPGGCADTSAGKTPGGEEPARPVRGLYTGLQREAQTGDAPRTTTGGRRREPGE